MTKLPNDDEWKDDFLARPNIPIVEFNGLGGHEQSWLLAHKHIFYNTGSEFVNLLHKRNKPLLDTLKKANFHVKP